MRKNIETFIPCECGEGGILLYELVDIYNGYTNFIEIVNVHSSGIEDIPSFWKRLKNAFKYIMKESFYTQSVVLSEASTIQFRDLCQQAIDEWDKKKLEGINDESIE